MDLDDKVTRLFTEQYKRMSEIETLTFKLGQISSIATLLAENLSDNVHSSVAWAIADIAKETDDKMYDKYEEVLSAQRLLRDEIYKLLKQNAKKGRAKKGS